MQQLDQKHCVPCEGGTPPLTHEEVQTYLPQLTTAREVVEDKKLMRSFVLKDFLSAVALINAIAQIAELEGHHPDLRLFRWNHLEVTLWTHAIGWLSENDFIVAEKINKLNIEL